jgi:hypothetical protein
VRSETHAPAAGSAPVVPVNGRPIRSNVAGVNSGPRLAVDSYGAYVAMRGSVSEQQRQPSVVAEVERIFRAAAVREPVTPVAGNERPAAQRALWLCTCETLGEAPAWLVFDDADGNGVDWRRIPDGLDIADVVAAREIAGGHTDVDAVLAWLQGSELYILDDGPTDDEIYVTLGQRLGRP